MSKEDIKCGVYIGVCVILCVILSTSWINFTSQGGTGGLTWSYSLDEANFCKQLQDRNVCDHIQLADKKECIETLEDKEACIAVVKNWEDNFNFECFYEIKKYNTCPEKTLECKKYYNQLYKCENKITRPKWMPLPNIRRNLILR
jgi:hypothetical protein